MFDNQGDDREERRDFDRTRYDQASRVISTGQLSPLLDLHFPPIDLVVSKDPSATEVEGSLILKWASRLDAFSGYPFRT